MFFKKNKNSQPAATVDQSTLGVSEMSDDDLIAVTGGVGSPPPSTDPKNSLGSTVSGAASSSSSTGAWTSSASGAISSIGNSSLLGLLLAGSRTSRVSWKLPN